MNFAVTNFIKLYVASTTSSFKVTSM